MSASARGPRTAKPKRSAAFGAAQETNAARSGATATGSTEEAPRILSFDEMVDLYAGEWILIRVSAYRGGWPSHGEVIARGPSRPTILEAWREVEGSREPGERHYAFRARRRIRTGAELREALEVLQLTWDGDEVPSVSGRS